MVIKTNKTHECEFEKFAQWTDQNLILGDIEVLASNTCQARNLASFFTPHQTANKENKTCCIKIDWQFYW
jgi:hypothetical protein